MLPQEPERGPRWENCAPLFAKYMIRVGPSDAYVETCNQRRPQGSRGMEGPDAQSGRQGRSADRQEGRKGQEGGAEDEGSLDTAPARANCQVITIPSLYRMSCHYHPCTPTSRSSRNTPPHPATSTSRTNAAAFVFLPAATRARIIPTDIDPLRHLNHLGVR